MIFRRVRGRVVPIKENKKMTYASRALTVGGAAIAGAGLGYGLKKFAGAGALALGMEVGAAGLAFGAFSGKGRLKAGAKSEAKNQALGWTVFGASALAIPKSRAALLKSLSKAASVVSRGKIGR